MFAFTMLKLRYHTNMELGIRHCTPLVLTVRINQVDRRSVISWSQPSNRKSVSDYWQQRGHNVIKIGRSIFRGLKPTSQISVGLNGKKTIPNFHMTAVSALPSRHWNGSRENSGWMMYVLIASISLCMLLLARCMRAVWQYRICFCQPCIVSYTVMKHTCFSKTSTIKESINQANRSRSELGQYKITYVMSIHFETVVLVDITLGQWVEMLGRSISPPIHHISKLVILSTCEEEVSTLTSQSVKVRVCHRVWNSQPSIKYSNRAKYSQWSHNWVAKRLYIMKKQEVRVLEARNLTLLQFYYIVS